MLFALLVSSTAIFAGAGARIHPGIDTAGVRVQAGLTPQLFVSGPYSLAAEVDFDFSTAADSFPQGDIRLYLWSGSAGLEARHDSGPIAIGIGPRIEAGWAVVRGTPNQGLEAQNAGAFFLAASLCLSLRIPIVGSPGTELEFAL